MQRFSRKHAFRKLWRLAGKPTAKLIRPISEWTLPAGVQYNERHDAFINEYRERVPVPWQAQPALEVSFLPQQGHVDVALDVPGQAMIGLTDILVLWSSEVETAVKQAWGVAVGEHLYTIRQWRSVPFGAQNPVTVMLSLQERTHAGAN